MKHNLNNFGEGVKIGSRIEADHISKLYEALSGMLETRISINGELKVKDSIESISGSFDDINTGGASISKNLQIGGDVEIGGETNIKGATELEQLIVNQGLTISGGVNIKDLPKTESTRFISYNEEGNLGYSTGSLREKFTPADITFQFTQDSLSDTHSFKGLINDISFYKTSLINNIKFSSKIDISPTWINHNNINDLQYWINSNIMGDRLNGDIFWIKIEGEYNPYTDGKSEVVFRYTIT